MYDDAFIQRLEKALINQLPFWGYDPKASLELITVSENATFQVSEESRQSILRVHRPEYHTKAEIESELAWLTAINNQTSLQVPAVLPTKDGRALVRLDLEDMPEIYAVAFEFLSGNEPAISGDLTFWFKELGKITAQLHAHSRTWQTSAQFTRKYWRVETMLGENGFWGDWKENKFLSSSQIIQIESAIELLTQRLKCFGESAERYGLVHADLRLANLLVDNNHLKVIDFDDCGYCWFMYDFAAAISFYETDPQMPELLSAWLSGYRDFACLKEEDEKEIPSMILLRRILLTAWLSSHSETPTAQEFGGDYACGTAKLAANYLASKGSSVW